jgi:phage/plasmid primase-like uncharacterized protein
MASDIAAAPATGAEGTGARVRSTGRRTTRGSARWQPHEVELAFHDALAAAGLRPAEGMIAGDGRLHRYRLADDKPGRKNGWAVLHVDGVPHGAAGSWKSGERLRWTPDDGRRVARTLDRRAVAEAAERVRAQRERADADVAAAIARRVQALWQGARPAAATAVDLYLDRHRGYREIIPASLRFVPALRHPLGVSRPAMLAAVTRWPSDDVVALHRTWLDPDTAGKAALSPNRMMLGPVAGGAVRLAACGERLAVSEGIETGLLAQQATGIPTWAALSAGGMEAVMLPALPLACEVFILADHDAHARGLGAAQALARRLVREGRSVRIALPDAVGSDWADVFAEATHVA